jgi:hypothetical protein
MWYYNNVKREEKRLPREKKKNKKKKTLDKLNKKCYNKDIKKGNEFPNSRTWIGCNWRSDEPSQKKIKKTS